jgi:endonuclease/exonuclease/phosphatase family metal-dependent hydrolase
MRGMLTQFRDHSPRSITSCKPWFFESDRDPFKVLTLNLHKGFSSFYRRFVLHDLREAIRGVSADIVFLQEVLGDHNEHSTRYEKWPKEAQYEFLADTIWDSYAYGRNAVYPAGHHGNALLSKLPILRYQNTDISITDGERRGLLHAVLAVPDRRIELHTVCVHMDLLERHRVQQLAKLCDFVHAEVPVDAALIVAGDFNDWRCRSHRLLSTVGLREAFVEHDGKAARTFPARWPLLRLDRVYVRNMRVNNPAVLSNRPWSHLSDHAALTVDLALT